MDYCSTYHFGCEEKSHSLEDNIVITSSTGVVSFTRCVETGEVQMPEPLERLMELMEQSRIYRIVKRVIDSVLDQYPEESEFVKQIYYKVKETLLQDLEKNREFIVKLPTTQRIIQWTKRNMNEVSI